MCTVLVYNCYIRVFQCFDKKSCKKSLRPSVHLIKVYLLCQHLLNAITFNSATRFAGKINASLAITTNTTANTYDIAILLKLTF